VRGADHGAAITVIDAASNLGAIAMPMSAELPVQMPAADTRKHIGWAGNDVPKISANTVVLAAAALFVVILVAASVAFPNAALDATLTGEFWNVPFGP
jgi:hypothetical protein